MRIEVEATDAEVIARLGELLDRSESHQLSTTCALGFSTTIFAWVAQRLRRKGDAIAETLAAKWDAETAAAAPWHLPPPLGDLSVFDALIRLRNASSHADGNKVHPTNDQHCLIGFSFEADQRPVVLHERDLRRFGTLIAQEFSAHMRATKSTT